MKPSSRIVLSLPLPLTLTLGLTLGLHAQLPDQPAAPGSLAPETLADFRAPLEATVTLDALHAKPAPRQSFTSGTNHFDDLNAFNFFHGGFEPMAFRPKMRAAATDPEIVFLDPAHAELVAGGFYDGARVRVYQPINGKLTKIRDARVKPGGHRASGWIPYRGQRNTTAETTEYTIAFDSSFRPDHPYWFTVRTVDVFGRESDNAAPVSARSGSETTGQTMAQPPAPWTRFQNEPGGTPPPPAPTGLRAESDDKTVTLRWDPAAGENISGYRVYVSGYDPSKHQGYALELESSNPLPSQPIQERDIVFIDHFKTTLRQDDRAPFSTWPATRNKVRSPFSGVHYQAPFGMWSDASDGYPATWRLVEHPAPVPEAMTGRGETCLHWATESNAVTGFPLTQYGSPTDPWYPALRAETYTVEAWVRGKGSLQLVFDGPYASADTRLPYGLKPRGQTGLGIEPVDFPLGPEWRKVTASFSVPAQFDAGLGSILLAFEGPGEFYLDNLRIYQGDHPFGDYDPRTHQRIRDMDIRYMRTHELIKTTWGYTLEGMTNHALANNYSGGTLQSQSFFTLLNNLRKAGNVSPWLQVEMSLAEEEWIGFAEWLCAPYDPKAGDTPESKPWAYKRWSMGQKEPWIDVFPEFAFEVANETWNQAFAPYDWDWGMPLTDGATGQNYSYGETYGLFNEYVIEQLRQSPYWNDAVEDKMRYMLCGWQAAPAFGFGAALRSPSADLVSYAAYISTDGLGDKNQADDFKRFYLMQWGISAVDGQSARNEATENTLLARGRAIESGIYEYGLGFRVGPGDPKAKEVDQKLFRSIIGAVATLDAGLTRYQHGMTDQAFFTFGHRIGSWGSHTTLDFGGHAYPYTKALDLYNEFGPGHFLKTDITSVPQWDFPAYEAEDNMHRTKRDARPDAPLVSLYASAEGDRLTLFLISRKLDGFPVAGDDGVTPATIRLPFRRAERLTAHRLRSDPRTDERFEETLQRESFDIPLDSFRGVLPVNHLTGGVEGGLPPASILAYVFEGVDLSAMRIPPEAAFSTPEVLVAGEPATLTADLDADAALEWSINGDRTFSGPRATLEFPAAGFASIQLTARSPNGLEDSLSHAGFPVSVRHGDRLWSFRTLPARMATTVRAEPKRDRLIVASRTPLAAEGFNPLLQTDASPRRNVLFEGTLEAVETETHSRNPLAGLVFATNRRAGLGFGLDDFERTQIAASLLVKPGGAVVSLTGQGAQTRPLGATVDLPARLRLSVEGSQARAFLQDNGSWRELASFTVPTDTGLIPALTTGGQGGETTATWSDVTLTPAP